MPVPALTVLIIHSERTFRRALGLALKQRGFDVVVVPDVQSGLGTSRDNPPRCVLVEPRLLMEETTSIKERVEKVAGRSLDLLALTYWANDEQRKAFRRHGAGLLAAAPEETEQLALQLRAISSVSPTPPWERVVEGRMTEQLTRSHSIPMPPTPLPPPKSGPPAPFDLRSALSQARTLLEAGELAAPVVPDEIGPRVLVVDDDPTFRAMMCELLATKRYRVYASINAVNALRYVQQKRNIDLIISDLYMPHMDGFELKSEIDRWCDLLVPFVLVTAHPSAENRKIAQEMGAAAFVAKPILNVDEFFTTLVRALLEPGSSSVQK